MSAATDSLAVGFAQLLAIHGEELGYIPASKVVVRESGEVVTDEGGAATLSDDTEQTVTAIFDDAYVAVGPGGVMADSVETVVIITATDLPDVTRGAIIMRDGEQYSVSKVETTQPDGSRLLYLSRQAH